ncbi:MAG TPA: hypothetical protein VG013_28745 [Gemmataceae bacterium]|jgi:hypothetical protein|nr:hypothetical protein [Gemmataceae bacterium]
MAGHAKEDLTPLEPEADDALNNAVNQFRDRLIHEARKTRRAQGGGEVSSGDVEAARQRLLVPPEPARGALKNIRAAFAQNKFIESVSYGMAITLFGLGAVLLAYGVFGPADATGRIAGLVGGSLAQVLLILPLRFATNARRHNFAITILGYLLDRVHDPKLLADLVRQLLGEVAPSKS